MSTSNQHHQNPKTAYLEHLLRHGEYKLFEIGTGKDTVIDGILALQY